MNIQNCNSKMQKWWYG